jgi:hypothetical protein
MQLTRHFTKVYTTQRKPLSQNLERFFEEMEKVVVIDVAFALTGKSPNDASVTGQKPKVPREKST